MREKVLGSTVYVKIRHKYPYYLLNLEKLLEMGSIIFNAQFTTLPYRSTN
jgi:hypothetical protein